MFDTGSALDLVVKLAKFRSHKPRGTLAQITYGILLVLMAHEYSWRNLFFVEIITTAAVTRKGHRAGAAYTIDTKRVIFGGMHREHRLEPR